jgi:sigma-E factor negative regulatory protein RseA
MSTNKRKEKISAFLDNEIQRDELMSFSLSSEPEDAEVMRRYQMIGNAMRGEMNEACFVDVSKAVHEALLDESTVVEKLVVEKHTTPASRTTSSDARADSGSFTLSAWFRPVAGMAVAASVALVMVVTLPEQDNPSPVSIVNNTAQQPVTKPALRLAAENNTLDKKAKALDPRLVNQHLEFATQDALQGRLPYVRAVSYQKNIGYQKNK